MSFHSEPKDRHLRLLNHTLETEHDRLFLWTPVLFGVGIATYFALLEEPSWMWVVSFILASALLFLATRHHPLQATATITIFLAVLGFANAKLRSESVAHPVWTKSGKAIEITAFIEGIERLSRQSKRQSQRILLRPFTLNTDNQAKLPYRIRIFSAIPDTSLKPGLAIKIRAVLRPPPPPVRPGGFDFAKKAWFNSLGAVGYAISKPEKVLDAPEMPMTLLLRSKLETLRHRISQKIRAVLPGSNGAVADALITGKRGGIDPETLHALRHSGLAHILAISGLHMALITGAIFWGSRLLLALWTRAVLSWPIKKYAALLALTGGAIYLIISGSSIATIRAFVMISIMLVAILLDRPALSLRNVALAAIVILLCRPENLLDVGFQMSFAAATCLVAAYETFSRRREIEHQSNQDPGPFQQLWAVSKRTWLYFYSIAQTTIIASLAVAPFAVFHFNKLAQYGLFANLLALPLVGLVIMPAALAALILMPFDWHYGPLFVMAEAIDYLISVAKLTEGFSGSVLYLPSFSALSLGLITLGGLWFIIWRTPWRWLAALPVGTGLVLATMHVKPDIYIDREMKAVALRTSSGKISVTPGQTGAYAIKQWLASDGDNRTVRQARQTRKIKCDKLGCMGKVQGLKVAIIHHPAALIEDCDNTDIVIITWPLNKKARLQCSTPKLVLDRKDSKRAGAIALYVQNGQIQIESATQRRGKRPWTVAHQR